MKKMIYALVVFFLMACAAPMQSINGNLQPPPDVQDNWNEKMCWQFISPLGRGVAIGGMVSGSIIFAGIGGGVDIANTDNFCDLTVNEMIPIGYIKLVSKTENSLIIERTDVNYVPMSSPRIDMRRYYVLNDGTMGVWLTLWEKLKSNDTERAFEVINEVQIRDKKAIVLKENVNEEEALNKHRRWVTEKANVK